MTNHLKLISTTSNVNKYHYNDIQQKVMKSQVESVSKVQSKLTKLPMLFTESGYLHDNANDFLLTRYHNHNFFNQLCENNPGRKSFSSISLVTLNNYTDHIRNWLNICASQGVSYLEVDVYFLEAVLEIMRDPEEDDNVLESSILNYISTWRLFYEYLDLMNISHKMEMPDKIRQERNTSRAEDNSDVLNYTHKDRKSVYFDDPLIKNDKIVKTRNYNNQALTTYQFGCLLKELRKIDVVYELMAKTQLDTLMRINEITHYFPYSKTRENPDWYNYGEMKINQLDLQPLKFIGKGQKERLIDVDIRTMKYISDRYLTVKESGYDTTIYDQRKHLFLLNFLPSKSGLKSNYTIKSDVLWLNKHGKPVSKTMYRNAFQQVAKILRNKNIISSRIFLRPHCLRHTGATLRLIKYGEETGIDICTANIDDIHIFLQDLLGHANQTTTQLYISTVRKLKIGDLSKKTIMTNEDIWKEELEINPHLKKGVDFIKS